MLHGIPNVLEDSSRQCCGIWQRTKGFENIIPAGSRHLRSISRSSRKNSHSNEERVDMLTVYGDAVCDGHAARWFYQERYPKSRLNIPQSSLE
ncbi:hypothetical protein TNCV_3743231 [Trichonephila clavipes]|nr:hypothetical protein TNCV_3743231 [Trichonephila clavipes]